MRMLQEKAKGLSKRISEFERELKELTQFRHDLESRTRVLESGDMEKIKHDLYKIESRMDSFESDHDKRKESWRTMTNFIVQLLWVCMAAWLLTKLGLQAPL